MRSALHIHIEGIVQGVGFRPFVYRIARRNLITGWVCNADDGVHIHAEGEEEHLDSFLHDLDAEAPLAAEIQALHLEERPLSDLEGFEIRSSAKTQAATTLVSPDIATCPTCVAELFAERDRRYHYPFINCTDCGPRFTIIDALPYDRPSTSMRVFEMCPDCAHEYADPLDRRFHAQPDACFACGPTLTFWRRDSQEEACDGRTRPDACGERLGSEIYGGRGSANVHGEYAASEVSEAYGESVSSKARGERMDSGGCTIALTDEGASPDTPTASAHDASRARIASDAIITAAADMLADGRIVAIKGLGGYHLACKATDNEAVTLLRERKHRYGKPLAIMVHSVDEARRFCEVDEREASLLSGSVRPIVLLERKHASAHTASTPLAAALVGNLHEVGVMLPYTPLQHLLLAAVDFPLVMTSGNISEEPILATNERAHEILGAVADAFIDNNRDILSRYDDSVVRIANGKPAFVRRARGYAPAPLMLDGTSENEAALLATGPEQKATFCLVRGTDAFVSQHIGDLENAETFSTWHETLCLYKRLFEIVPARLVCDMHPEYLTTKWAHEEAVRTGLPLVEVQHHHAHIASVLAENGRPLGERVIGLALDGTGYGTDGAIWGGEVLVASRADFTRFAHLRYLPMPGGAAAITHPARMAFGALKACGLSEHPAAQGLLERLGSKACTLMSQMVEKQLNCPRTSSMGRLFDVASALLDLGDTVAYDGAGACELEAALYGEAGGDGLSGPDGAYRASEPDSLSGMDGVETTGKPGKPRNPIKAGEARMADPEGEAGAERGAAGGEAGGGDGEHETRGTAYRFALHEGIIDPTPLLTALLDDKAAGVSTALIAQRFHNAIVQMVVEVCSVLRAETGLSVVALSGGCFMNRYLLTHVPRQLERAGFEVLLNVNLPANDGCIAYGQAAVARALPAAPMDCQTQLIDR